MKTSDVTYFLTVWSEWLGEQRAIAVEDRDPEEVRELISQLVMAAEQIKRRVEDEGLTE